MDDQQTYLLNGLLARQYDLGRIVRFRQVPRGRQAVTHELLTAQQNEYLVSLYPPAYTADHLNFVAVAINALDANRFSIVPVLPAKSGDFTAEGPQGSHMLVSLSPPGTALPLEQYTTHDISQVGLRLAWMHRLLKEQLPAPEAPLSAAKRLPEVLAHPTAESARLLPAFPPPLTQSLCALADLPLPFERGWTHGDIQLPALLHDSDHQLRSLVDWGLLHHGLPLEDLVDAFLALCADPQGHFSEQRGRALLEAYDSLLALKQIPWTPVVANWCAQRIIDAAEGKRPLPKGFSAHLTAPERLATTIASCQ